MGNSISHTGKCVSHRDTLPTSRRKKRDRTETTQQQQISREKRKEKTTDDKTRKQKLRKISSDRTHSLKNS